MLASLVGLSHVLTAAFVTASFGAPIEWSRDGRWVAHVAVASSDAPALPPRWPLDPDGRAHSRPPAPAPRRIHRIWATPASGTESVLLEESTGPVTSPTWGPDGRTIVYGRFVSSREDGPSSLRGRFEAVVQTGLDRKRSILLHPDVELDEASRATICLLRPTLSSDGRRLAMPRPGPQGGFWIVRLDEDRVTRTVAEGRSPAWSPDGLRVAYLRIEPGPSGEPAVSVHLMNPGGGADRLLNNDPALTPSPPAWNLEGQAVLMLASPTRGPLRHAQVDLTRIQADTGFATRLSTVEAAATINGQARFRGRSDNVSERLLPIRVDLSLDAEQEQGAGIVDSGDGDQSVKVFNVRTQNTFKKFQPLDAGLRIAAPSLSPDGHTLALRVEDGTPAGLAFFCDLNTEEITPLAPDDASRERWLDRLAACAVERLQEWSPMRTGEGADSRATILPILAELGGIHPRQYRLQRLARFAHGVLGAPLPPTAEGEPSRPDPLATYRLFFAYLNRDYDSAEAYLDAVEKAETDSDARLRWLCLRAQILLSRGDLERTRGIITYIEDEVRTRVLNLEESPTGRELTSVTSPVVAWAEHLARMSADGVLNKVQAANAGLDPDEAGFDPAPGNPQQMPNLPFAPNPGADPGLNLIPPGEFGDFAPPRPRLMQPFRPDRRPRDAGRQPAPAPPPVLQLEFEN